MFNNTPLFSNKTYDKLKWFLTIVVPATITLIAGLDSAGVIHNGNYVNTLLGLFSVFLGSIFGISSVQYKNSNPSAGTIEVSEVEDKIVYSFNVEKPLDEFSNGDTIYFQMIGNSVNTKS